MDIQNTATKAKAIAFNLSTEALKKTKNIRRLAVLNGALVATTVMSGAFVAGNDAGHAFNTFPMMNDRWIPEEIMEMQPQWRNFFENTATVQFDHRVLALSTLAGITGMYAYAKKAMQGALWASLPKMTRIALTATNHMALLQVGLGITTLLLNVPIPVAIVHQV